MHLNIDKTLFCISPKQNSCAYRNSKVNDIKIKCVKQCKYLAVIIDNELK